MRWWQAVWSELSEVVWLASIVWSLSVLAVTLAVALALAMDTKAAPAAFHKSPAALVHP